MADDDDDDFDEHLTKDAAVEWDAIWGGLVVGLIFTFNRISDFNEDPGLTIGNVLGSILLGIAVGIVAWLVGGWLLRRIWGAKRFWR